MSQRVTSYTRQRPIKGGRLHGSTGFEPRVWAAIQRTCRRFHCSLPRYFSTLAADAEGIDLDEQDRFDGKPAHVKKGRMLKIVRSA